MNEEKKELNNQNPRKRWTSKFTLRELGGAFGDWGTLIPFIIGYVSIVGLNPAGIFLCLGLTNIILGIRFNLPLPVQPQKTISTVALAESWTPSLVISTGFGTGVIWSILGGTKLLEKIVRKVPTIAVRGIQLGLSLTLGWTALLLIGGDLRFFDVILGGISLIIIILLINNKKIPSSIILVILGIIILFVTGGVLLSDIRFSLPTFDFYIPQWNSFVYGMISAGIPQLFLTLTNVMIATIILIKDLFPEREDIVSASSLALSMGVMNLGAPFIGGIPLCHGSGGLAAQYAFGARTGGSMILEGLLEITLGLFLSETLFSIFVAFPQPILGAMLLYTAFLLGKLSFKEFDKKTFPIIAISALFCFFINITIGFIIGLVLYLLYKLIINKRIKNQDQSDSTQK